MNKFLILAICMTTLSGCVIQRGMHVRTGEYRQPSDAESVRIYGQKPSSYKVLGMVRGEGSHAFVSDQYRMDKAIERMKKEAAALGANGGFNSICGKPISTITGSSKFWQYECAKLW